jgi:hypothetical protein
MDIWQYPEGGRFSVAVPGDEEVAPQVEAFFGRELARYNHAVYWQRQAYMVFFFAERADAEKCIATFKGEWFDERDKGRGPHWAQWYKNRYAKRTANKSPYDFSKD